jgi:hypothetical protein
MFFCVPGITGGGGGPRPFIIPDTFFCDNRKESKQKSSVPNKHPNEGTRNGCLLINHPRGRRVKWSRFVVTAAIAKNVSLGNKETGTHGHSDSRLRVGIRTAGH